LPDTTGREEMMKFSKTLFLLTLVLAVSLVAGSVLAEEKVDKEKSVKEMSGKDLYKKACKSCHDVDSDAGEYTPMSLIVEQWEEFFDGDFAETHNTVVCPSDPEKMVSDHFSKDMLKKIKKFCIDHAADSEQPMTCG
jgi:hypothetical protein